MTIKKSDGAESIPEETSKLAWRMSPKGTSVMHLRDALGTIYTDEQFEHLFPRWGRPGEAPWRLALVTVLQEIEGMTDRQAAEAVLTRIDWRYALSLSLDDPGFNFSILSDFRSRLLSHGAADLLLSPILQVCRERGWLKARGKQRTDSTAVLARLRALSSLESVGESMRAALNRIAEQDPEWLLSHVNPEWFDRYVHRFELVRFPKEESKRKQLRQDVGQDVQRLLTLVQEAKEEVGNLAEIALLDQIFGQHYEVKEGEVHWRDGPAVSNEERVVSPYDKTARSSRKRETTWLGYKVHLTETCDQDPTSPHLVVQVETVPATTQDSEMLSLVQEHLREKKLAPSEQYVDQGYSSGPQLVEQLRQGTHIVAPVPLEGGWQAASHSGYAAHDFQLDWDRRIAICPQGKTSSRWSRRLDERKQPIELIRFAKKVCLSCPVHTQCSQGTKQGRSLSLNVQEVHLTLLERRQEQVTPTFQKSYARRAGIEGTISQGVRVFRLRQTPYVGTAKTQLHHLAVAAGINLLRIEAHLQAQARGKPTRPSRPLTPFARLQQRWEVNSA